MVYRRIAASQIVESPLLSLSFGGPDQDLTNSLNRWGILNPIHGVEEAGCIRIIDGWRRVIWAREHQREVPVRIWEGLQGNEFVPLAIACNRHREFSAVEVARALGDTPVGGYPVGGYPEGLGELLGLHDPKLVSAHRAILQLPPELQNWIHQQRFPRTVLLAMHRFPVAEVESLWHLFHRLRLNQNRLMQCATLLYEIAQHDGSTITTLVDSLVPIPSGEEFQTRLIAKRYPRLTQRRKALAAFQTQLGLPRSVVIKHDDHFESGEVLIEARLSSAEEGKRLGKVLNDHAWEDYFKDL